MSDKPVSRNPRQDYLKMGLQIGDRLIFDGLEQKVITVAGPHTLPWDGTEYYTTKIRKALEPLVGRKTFNVNKILVSDGWKLDDLYYSLHQRPSEMAKRGKVNIPFPQRRRPDQI